MCHINFLQDLDGNEVIGSMEEIISMTNKERLEKLIAQIDTLISEGVDCGNPDFCAWKEQSTKFLIRVYGANSHELKRFNSFHFTLTCFSSGTPSYKFNAACVRDLERVRAIFKSYVEEMEEDNSFHPDNTTRPVLRSMKKIFIVHGHDGELKQSVARLIEKQNLTAVILGEQVNRGATIIEKIEKNDDVGAAICLFTADDKCIGDGNDYVAMRARQNVVLEAGYFIGKLGRENVVLLAEKGIDMPSDLGGVVYTDVNNWQLYVCAELKKIGFSIDLNRLI